MEEFLTAVQLHLSQETFIKLTLSKPVAKVEGPVNVYARVVNIKGEPKLSITYRYPTQDTVKNFSFSDSLNVMKELLKVNFQIATLRTTTEDIVLRRTKRGKVELARLKASSTTPPEQEHDKVKEKRAEGSDGYLFHLGITDKNGKVIQRMADKFRQINKYLEIMEGLISAANLSGSLRVVDMGAGKGYLTFALYDFLVNKLNLDVSMTGVEMRQGLVDDGNKLAQKCRFEKLKFESSEIADFDASGFNIVIALHACDTATDDAIAKGIGAGAELIVCAPCCHKQIRQQLKGKEHNNPLLKYGIFKEREFEMVTDTLRALILERNGYKSNIFEFISNEHTRKNTMLVGTRSNHKADTEAIDQKITALKQDYQIEYHYLEKLV